MFCQISNNNIRYNQEVYDGNTGTEMRKTVLETELRPAVIFKFFLTLAPLISQIHRPLTPMLCIV